MKNKKKKKKHGVGSIILKSLVIIILILAILAGLFVAYSTFKNGWGISGMLKTAMGHDKETVKNLGEFRVLLLGVSVDISARLTDTIMVASYNPQKQTISLMSIPRDTYTGSSDKNATPYYKINTMYQTGIDKLLKKVNEITGLNIKNYIVIETTALVKLVDTIGGVDFDVPINMDYDDVTQDLHIHLKAGQQKLNGKQSEWVVRFRHNNNYTTYPVEYGDNDTGRMRTQRAFISEVIKQTINAKNITKLGEIMDIVYEYVETNIKINDAKDYLPYLMDFNAENIKTGTLPGVNALLNGYWFFKYDKAKTKTYIEDLFNLKEDSSTKTITRTTTTTSNTSSSVNNEKSKIKVEIINGSGSADKLKAVEAIIKKQGYSIAKTSSTDVTKTTTVINNTGKDSEAQNISKLISNSTVIKSKNSTSSYDITIIIGTNYK